MPKMPVDVGALLEAMTDVDAARQMPLHVALFIDPTAPEDIARYVRGLFTTTSARCTVEPRDFARAAATVRIGCDVAVLLAADSPETGPMVKVLNGDGVPAVVVTASPDAIASAAAAMGDALAAEDVVAPDPAVDGGLRTADDPLNQEPYPLTVDRERTVATRLGEWFVATFQRKRLAFALAFPFVRKPLANSVIALASIENAGIGAIPLIPGADMPLMTANQARMVLQIAAAYGLDIGTERWRELAVVVGSGFVGRTIAREAAGIVPGLGWAVRGGVGAAMTQAMGRAAVAWFEKQTGGVYEAPRYDGRRDALAARAQDALGKAVPYIKGAGAAAETLAIEAVGTLSSAAVAAAPHALGALRKAAAAASPYAGRVGERIAPFAAHGVGALIPGLRAAIEEFCKREGLDPDHFVAEFLDSYSTRRSR